VDNCCINKVEFTGLSKAINCMFRWCHEATRCYVYRSDLPTPTDPTSTVESSFPDSRWFKRGWTTQELIAPSLVQFFSREGESIGNKKSREQQLHQICEITLEALQATPLAKFSIVERLSWAANRATTGEKDPAYCRWAFVTFRCRSITARPRKRPWTGFREIFKSL
jgi:hypothetical protein